MGDKKSVAHGKYSYAVIATDVVIFTMIDDKLNVLLIQMNKLPYVGYWAIPGGLVQKSESLDASARRQLREKGGIDKVHLEQLYTFGEVDRDPYGRVVSVAYEALIPRNTVLKLKTLPQYSDIRWHDIEKLPKLAYDHSLIIKTAVERLKAKLEYTNIAVNLLQEEFTLTEMQETYETILGIKLDKRNFRKKILALKLLKQIGKKKHMGKSRPAELYKFVKNTPQIVNVL